MSERGKVDGEVRGSEPFGFLLLTKDPEMLGGRRGEAYDLVQARLKLKRWPIFERTPHRAHLQAGARVGFYVAGQRTHRGTIVATARVRGVTRFQHRVERVDPSEYLTDPPHLILELEDLNSVSPPISFLQRLPKLSFRLKNPSKWGILLQGGVRALSQGDWQALFSS